MSFKRYVTLNTGTKMDLIGYGTWQAGGAQLEESLEKALDTGYRHIDTATRYNNEHVIGKVLQRWISAGKVKREDLFITTKLPHVSLRRELVSKCLDQSLLNLQLDYVDLYLIHAPFGLLENGARNEDGTVKLDMNTDHKSVWKAMEAQVDVGKAKAIGISNFNQSQIQRILDNATIKPANLQVELQIFLQQKLLVEFCKKNNISVTSYSTLGSRGGYETLLKGKTPVNIIENEVVQDVAKKYNKSGAQVLLRFWVQQQVIVIPKSTNENRLKENFQIFDFSLSAEDMEALSKLDKGEDGRLYRLSELFPGLINHPEYPFPY